MSDEPPENPRWRNLWYGVAALIGLGVALGDIVQEWRGVSLRSPDHVVAHVGDSPISMDLYQEVVADLAADSKDPLTDADRQFALQRLIDEELLIQRARELGLDATVAGVRKAMANAVIAQVVAEASAELPSEDLLRELYDNERDYFARPPRYAVTWYRITGLTKTDTGLVERIRSDLQRQPARSETYPGAIVRAAAELPPDPLPAAALSNYLGATLTATVETLAPSEYSAPQFLDGIWHLLYLREKTPAAVPDFQAIRSVVRVEYQRRNADRALEDYLAWLAGRTDIEINQDVR